jgi:hypothetical protein
VTGILIREAGIIQSVCFDQHEILMNIMSLYCPSGFELDPTYGAGGFYRHAGIPRPQLCFDLAPRRPEIPQADVCRLPLESSSIGSAIFDPPWMIHGQEGASKAIFVKKYGGLQKLGDLWALCRGALAELARVLKPAGILVFKCQDFIWGRQNYFFHVWAMEEAERVGLRAKDLFIFVSKTRPIPWNMERQNHARKMHSYFWVFKKRCR